MNVFSKCALDELKQIGLKPSSILHVKEKDKKVPLPAFVLTLPNATEGDDEKECLLCGYDGEVHDITASSCYGVSGEIIMIRKDNFFM